jgi:hypothetical protein
VDVWDAAGSLVKVLSDMGLPGVVIAALLVAVLYLWRRHNKIQDARLADRDRHSKELRELSIDYAKNTERTAEALEDLAQRRGL